jgi:hypothetical protein
MVLKTGADKLRLAEKGAKEARIRIWKDYQATGPQVGYFDMFFMLTVPGDWPSVWVF